MRFMVVDGSSTMRRIITNTLQKLGHQEILEASNGREALDRLSGVEVDMVITDWHMAEMNGIQFVRTLRKMERYASLPILMVTTNAAKDDIVEAMRSGVTNYVVKPFTPDTIREKIEAVVAAKCDTPADAICRLDSDATVNPNGHSI